MSVNGGIGIDWAREQDEVVVEIDGFGFQGEGYARLSDGWLSVRGALPGERVRVRVEAGQRERLRRLWATLLEVERAAPERRDPACERASICRGCQLRHATVARELAFHADGVAQVMGRYGGLEEGWEVEVVAPEGMARGDATRMRTSVAYAKTAEGFELGLISPGREALVGMSGCPALTGSTRRLVEGVEEAMRALGTLPDDEGERALERVQIASPAHGRGRVVLVARAGSPELDALSQALAERLPKLVGLFVERGGELEHVQGPDQMRVSVGEHVVGVGPRAWFHATGAPAEALYAALPGWLEVGAAEDLLVVGCGVGTIGVVVGEEVGSVTGIDASLDAIHSAELNAAASGLGHARYIAGDWERALRDLALAQERFDVAAINPMREPLGARALSYLSKLGVRRVVYMGPSPVSAAKDVAELRAQGWQVRRLGVAALHPATHHAMALVALERSAAGEAAL